MSIKTVNSGGGSTFKGRWNWRNWLIGKPLASADAPHQTIGKAVGLAVFASDALSSTAYATQEILVILAAVGTGAFGLSIPIALAIVALLAIVTISYEQTIHAYPSGGGAYIVALDNLGPLAAKIAGAALLTDYILTVAVSVSSAVAQLESASPQILPYKVLVALGMVAVIMLINLRGVKESGFVFSIPTYFFIAMMLITVGRGFFQWASGSLGTLVDLPELHAAEAVGAVGWFLILRAFASGTAALTGVEAISNGITAFKEPRSRNAGITLIWMAVILGTLFLGITILSHQIGAVPSESETVISQLARTVFGGRNTLYLLSISATTIILAMAANTAFADFPRLSAILAGDRYLPRMLTYRGSRLVFSYGIVLLSVVASLLMIVFRVRVSALIPLYAVGVFMSFTLSQAGMALRWRKIGRLAPKDKPKQANSGESAETANGEAELEHWDTEDSHEGGLKYDPNWKFKMVVNSFGAACTFVVMIIFGVTKFVGGAWVIIVLIPLLVAMFSAIHRHYEDLRNRLSLEHYDPPLPLTHNRVIFPVSGVHRGTLAAIRFAQAISGDITGVHVSLDPADSAKVKEKWEQWCATIPLVIIESPYRVLLEPLLEYIKSEAAKVKPNETITVVVPEFVARRGWHNFLHMQTSQLLQLALLLTPGVVIVEVPYQVE